MSQFIDHSALCSDPDSETEDSGEDSTSTISESLLFDGKEVNSHIYIVNI